MFTKAPFYLLFVVLCHLSLGTFASNTETSRPQVELAPRQSGSTQIAAFASAWSSVSSSFSTCQSTFSQRVSVQVAVQAVATLYQKIQPAITQYSSCGCGSAASTQTQYVSQFRQSITQTYQSWQSILQTGQQVYASEWKSQFSAQFQQFNGFIQASKSACSSVNINLGSLLSGIGLNLNLFTNININLGGILNISIGGQGGLLGGILRRENQKEIDQ